MTKVYCGAMDCKFNGDNGVCRAEKIVLSDHSVMTTWEGRQRYQKCRSYRKSQETIEMEKFFTKAVMEVREKLNERFDFEGCGD